MDTAAAKKQLLKGDDHLETYSVELPVKAFLRGLIQHEEWKSIVKFGSVTSDSMLEVFSSFYPRRWNT